MDESGRPRQVFSGIECDDAQREKLKSALREIQAEHGMGRELSYEDFKDGLKKRDLSIGAACSYFLDLEGLRAVANPEYKKIELDLKKLIEFIKSFYAQNHNVPTYKQAAEGLGLPVNKFGSLLQNKRTNYTALCMRLGLKKLKGE